MRTHLRRALLGLTTSAVVAGSALVSAPAHAAHPRAELGGDWLAGQLNARNLVVSSWTDGTDWYRYTDHGLTLDVLFALEGAEVRRGVRSRILATMETEANAYVAPAGSTYAGALGKLLTAVQVEGRNPGTYAGGGRVGELEALVAAGGPEAGRAEDEGSTDATDTSNTIGQSWVVRALAMRGSARAGAAVSFLLRQQCAGGGFRLYMESPDFSCATGSAAQRRPSVDATALAVQALVVARQEGQAGLQDDIDDAVGWLVARQRPGGSFRELGVANANSTGLAAETLAMTGERGAAGNAAAWLRRKQVAGALATGELAREDGAVAFDAAALRDGRRDGITRAVRYQWRRATSQAVTGLDALLGAKELDVRAPRRAEVRERVAVVAEGLRAGERFTVRRGAKVVATGLVGADATVRVAVRMPRQPGKVAITVTGSRGNRAGSDVVRVR